MDVEGSRVAVIGGSIAGCAAAIALRRAGCTVEVYERSEGELRDRGSGIGIPLPLREELIEAGYLPADYPWCRIDRRWWIHADGSPTGRVLWEQPGQGAHNNWGVLWRGLRANVDDGRYHAGRTMVSFTEDADGVDVTFDDGSVERFDVLVGADGYRSKVREHLHPGTAPIYAGYILWRGNYPGRSITEMGRRIGRAQVEQTPNWAVMTPADFEAWIAATLAGETLYFYGSEDNSKDD